MNGFSSSSDICFMLECVLCLRAYTLDQSKTFFSAICKLLFKSIWLKGTFSRDEFFLWKSVKLFLLSVCLYVQYTDSFHLKIMNSLLLCKLFYGIGKNCLKCHKRPAFWNYFRVIKAAFSKRFQVQNRRHWIYEEGCYLGLAGKIYRS